MFGERENHKNLLDPSEANAARESMSAAATVFPVFRAAAPTPPFFLASREASQPRQSPQRAVGGVPAVVVPSLRERVHGTRPPVRAELLTAPRPPQPPPRRTLPPVFVSAATARGASGIGARNTTGGADAAAPPAVSTPPAAAVRLPRLAFPAGDPAACDDDGPRVPQLPTRRSVVGKAVAAAVAAAAAPLPTPAAAGSDAETPPGARRPQPPAAAATVSAQTARSGRFRVPALPPNAAAPLNAATAAAVRSARFLADYDGGREAAMAADDDADAASPFDAFDERRRVSAEAAEGTGAARSRGAGAGGAAEEGSIFRVVKMAFRLSLTRGSPVVALMKALDPAALHRRLLHEVGHRKQLTRDEFHGVVARVLRTDFLSRRDSANLFALFDNDSSGLVDAAELVCGFMGLVASNEDDVSFRFLRTLLEGRERNTVHAFLSRFELQVLLGAAQRFFEGDADVVAVLAALPDRFDFSHLGRTPAAEFRRVVLESPQLRAIFDALPMLTAARDLGPAQRSMSVRSLGDMDGWMRSPQLVADQHIHPAAALQASAAENDSPRWWLSGETIYRSSALHPYPEPMFYSHPHRV